MITSWEASTSMSNQKLILEDAITLELTKGDYSVLEAPSHAEAASQPEAASPYEAASQSEPYSRSELYPPLEANSELEVSSLASTVLPRTIFAKKASYRNAALSIIALSLIIGMAAYFTGQDSTTPNTAEQTVIDAESNKAADPSEAPEAATVQVQIDVEPKTTVLTIDGENLPGNPYAATRTLSAEVHELVASAPGYKTSRRKIRLDTDLQLRFALDANKADEIKMQVTELPRDEPEEPEAINENKEPFHKRGDRSDKDAPLDAKKRTDPVREDKSRAEDEDTGTVEPDKKATPSPDKKSVNPGDALRHKKDQRTRKIDKDNPYN
jgi:hypothetical protein